MAVSVGGITSFRGLLADPALSLFWRLLLPVYLVSDGTLQWSNRVATCFSFRHPCPEPVLSLDGTTLFVSRRA